VTKVFREVSEAVIALKVITVSKEVKTTANIIY
jgi:hypothetical protein